jgi:hypothetical protein
VTAGKERHQNFLDDRVLADDRVAQLVPQTRREALRLVELHWAKLYRGSCNLTASIGTDTRSTITMNWGTSNL